MIHGWIGKCWGWCHNKSLGQLLLRLTLGLYFIGHALAKFQSMSGTVAMFGQWGFSPLFAYAASISELVAGIAIVLGAFMWVAAALIVIVMAVAVYAVVGPNPEGEPWMFHYIFGWGPNAIYAAAALSLAFTGAGKWSLTGLMMNRWKKRAECKDCMISYGAQCTCAEPHAPDCACTLCGCAIK